MPTEQNKQLVLRWREALNRGDLNAIDDLFAPDFVGYFAGTPGPIRGREALKGYFARYLAALDVQLTPEFLIAEGDLVAVHDMNRIKHTREFQGRPPTGKELSISSTDIYRVVDGRIVEQWFEADVMAGLQQVGLLPSGRQDAGVPLEQSEGGLWR